MVESWLKKVLNLGQVDETRKAKPSTEEAIKAWENDAEMNPERHKIVRGADGKPVEIVTQGRDTFAFLINGSRRPLPEGSLIDALSQALGQLEFQQFLHGNVFDGTYELKGVQRLDANVGNDHQGFLSGVPTSPRDTFTVRAG